MRLGDVKDRGPAKELRPAQAPFWSSWAEFWAFVRSGFSRWSLVPVGMLAVVAGAVTVGWWDLVDLSQPFDPLLAGLWTLMTLLISWRVRPARDAVLALAGLGGGFVIEWWGTSTELWTYFTNERPPLWILPAWPVAALATERLSYVLHRAFPTQKASGLWRLVYGLSLLAFLWRMGLFMAPSWQMRSSQVVLCIMLGVTVSSRGARRDMTLFVMGTALGWFLEYWGTTRECWTYYTHQTPPWVTAFAHGFASVAFCRAVQSALGLWTLLQRRLSGLRRRALLPMPPAS